MKDAVANRREPAMATLGDPGEFPEFTPREREVLSLLAQGGSIKSIARDLDISVNTCRSRIRAIADKLRPA